MKDTYMKLVVSLLVIFVAGTALYFGLTYKVPLTPVPQESQTAAPQDTTQASGAQNAMPTNNSNILANAVFTCTSSGKSIHAVFLSNPDSVKLSLSDGRNITLPHALSADGARYTNADESFVFWNKGNGAFIEENGKNTYEDCTTTPSGQ